MPAGPVTDTSDDVACNLCGTLVPGAQAPVWHKDGFDIVRCARCGLMFRRALPAAVDLQKIYSNEYFQRPAEDTGGQGYDDYLAEEELHRLNARYRVERLAGLAPGNRLYDVGAAAGFFMDEARTSGWEVQGVDISPEMAGWGRRELALDLAIGSFHTEALQEGSYDCMTMWDYIEHSIDPAADLARAHALLRPGGIIALSTGDVASAVARASGERWHLLTPHHHNFYFSPRTLGLSCEHAGFAVHDVGHPAARYSLRYLTFKLRSMAPESALVRRVGEAFEASRAGRAAVPVNLWDIMTLVARKPSPVT